MEALIHRSLKLQQATLSYLCKRWHSAYKAVARASCSIFLVLALLCSASVKAEENKAPTYPKVLLIGVDGLSINMLDGLSPHGWIPNLTKLREEGVVHDLESIWPLRTPQVWTSVVTGKLPGQHGIWDHHGHSYFNPPEVRTKTKTTVTAKDRQSKALWQILDSKYRTLTVGWMASWPADTLHNGLVIAPIELKKNKRQTTIKGSFYRGHPEGLVGVAQENQWQQLTHSWIIDAQDVTKADLHMYADLPPKKSPLRKLPYLERYIYGLRWSHARAQSVEALSLNAAASLRPDIVLSYFQCPDSLLHRFWIFHKGPEAIAQRLNTHRIRHQAQDPEKLHQHFGSVVKGCYQDLDARLGRLFKALKGPDTLVMIVSDHGFGNAPIPHRLKGEPYSGDHLEEGIVMLSGPSINHSKSIFTSSKELPSVLDITPTLLHYLNQPVAKDMQGKVWPIVQNSKAIQWVESYESQPQTQVLRPEGWPPRTVPPRHRAGNGPIGY